MVRVLSDNMLYPYAYNHNVDMDSLFLERLVDKIKLEREEFEIIERMYCKAVKRMKNDLGFNLFYVKKLDDCYIFYFKSTIFGLNYLFSFDVDNKLLWEYSFDSRNELVGFDKDSFLIKERKDLVELLSLGVGYKDLPWLLSSNANYSYYRVYFINDREKVERSM